MNFYPVYYIVAITMALTVLIPASAKAQTLGGGKTPNQELLLISNDTNFTLPSSTINTWRGSYMVTHTSSLLRPNSSLYQLVAFYLGDKKAVPHNSNNYAEYSYNPGAAYDWVKDLASRVDRTPAAPVLEIENKRAVKFQPPTPGLTLNVYETTRNILTALETGARQASLAISTTVAPDDNLSATNDLGIRELLAEGVSNFSGSPRNRIHNIHVGVKKMQGVIIAPGDEFSFNKYLGPVEASEGFLPELVIKANETIPELGGGLCQVSTTTFRAAMKAGLPITARRNHAYAVKYYAPQGTDATIYPGVQDLTFVNDTPASILIWPYVKDTYTLVFAFYGTKDDRQITIEDPVQFDRKTDGSMKATWKRTVIKDDTPKVDVFRSTYRSPALYHKKEQFVPASPTPETPTQPDSTPAPPASPPENAPPSNSPTSPTNSNSTNQNS